MSDEIFVLPEGEQRFLTTCLEGFYGTFLYLVSAILFFGGGVLSALLPPSLITRPFASLFITFAVFPFVVIGNAAWICESRRRIRFISFILFPVINMSINVVMLLLLPF
jgi:hypothetical protein